MSSNDPDYLSNVQYRDATNLSARARLHACFSLNPRPWFDWYFEQLELPESSRVLELGCGPGWVWWENRERIRPGWELVLTDLSPGMLEEARKNLSTLRRPLTFQCVDAQALPFPDASYDAVIANHMLYHVPDRQRAFAEIRRVLKGEGCLYAATNGELHMSELDQLVRGVAPELGRDELSMQASEFTIENGAAQLAARFSDVRLLLYQDALRVTEVEPLVAYVLSVPASKMLSREQVEQLRAAIAAQFVERGSFCISKAVGVFKARY